MYARRIEDIQEMSYTETRRIRAQANEIRDVKLMTERELRSQLCDAGPLKCPECKGCAYGREMALRRKDDKEPGGITREGLMRKYGAGMHDANFVTTRTRPIGQTKDKHPSKLYDERKAALALAGIWRGRAKTYAKKAEEWNARADQAERLAGEIGSGEQGSGIRD